MRNLLILSTATLALAACTPAPTTEELHIKARTATAEAVSGVAADAIQITNLQQTTAKSSWEAQTPNGVFACSSDQRFALPDCQPAS